MLKLLNQIPILGDFVTKPLLDTLHVVVNGVQFIVGI